MGKLKIGIIGTGNISNFHMQGYKKLENVEVIAACDLNADRVKAFAEKYGVKHVFTDYNEMLKLDEIDAVSVCTWNNGHAPASISAMKAGKHVLCEKPLALNAKEAEEMERVSKETGKLLMVGFVRRFGQNTKIMGDFIRKGHLGDIYYARTSCVRRCGNPCGWFSDKNRSGGGPLIDLGVHMIDLSRFLMGKPKAVSVYGAVFNNIGPRNHVKAFDRYRPVDKDDFCDVEDLATALIRFDNGAVLSVETSFSQNIKEDMLTLELFGTKSGAMLEPKLELYTEMEDYIVDVTPRYSIDNDPFINNFKNETAHFVDCITKGTFVDCITKGTQCLNPVEDGVELMRVLDAIYESAAQRKEVIIMR